MERVVVLINKLQQQLSQGASIQHMLVTAQLLQSELMFQAKLTNGQSQAYVSVMVPNYVGNTHTPSDQNNAYKPVPKPEPETIPVPETDDEPIMPAPHPGPRPEPEPVPVAPMLEDKPWQHIPIKTETGAPWPIDPLIEVPTLAAHEKVYYELNDTIKENDGSLNEKLKQDKVEMVSVLQDSPVRDLKKAISINERHRFINELFRGDETMYERSVKTINGFNIFAEAEYWIQRELKLKVGWDANSESVKIFDQLVKRRFS